MAKSIRPVMIHSSQQERRNKLRRYSLRKDLKHQVKKVDKQINLLIIPSKVQAKKICREDIQTRRA
jgi:hypothetical protein